MAVRGCSRGPADEPPAPVCDSVFFGFSPRPGRARKKVASPVRRVRCRREILQRQVLSGRFHGRAISIQHRYLGTCRSAGMKGLRMEACGRNRLIHVCGSRCLCVRARSDGPCAMPPHFEIRYYFLNLLLFGCGMDAGPFRGRGRCRIAGGRRTADMSVHVETWRGVLPPLRRMNTVLPRIRQSRPPERFFPWRRAVAADRRQGVPPLSA